MATPEMSRRARSKQEKLERITRAASDLFAERAADEVTTREVADRADVATGTLFLYAQNKGELLLLAHNAAYEQALARGRAAAAAHDRAIDAVMAMLGPIVACNRSHVENGRTYLREMVFGDPREPHHAAAVALSQRTEQAVAEAIERCDQRSPTEAAGRARLVSAALLLVMGSPRALLATDAELLAELRSQLVLALGRD